VDRATFIVQFPEFATTKATVVDAMLAAAELEIDREVWNEKGDQGQAYLAAHKLALSPYGNAAQMVFTQPKPGAHGDTAYGVHFDSLVMQVASGFRVA
jgi:hypothetical protein